MHIILEGPDNAGKTTLAKAIVCGCIDEGFHILYRHPGGPPKDDTAESYCIAQQYGWLWEPHNLVLDRCTPISQSVYNPSSDLYVTAGRNSGLDSFVALGVIFIYCRPSTDRLLRTQDITWRPNEPEEHKRKIIDRQHEFVERYDRIMRSMPCIFYDFEDKPMAKHIVDHAVQAIGGRKESLNNLQYLIRRGQ